MTTMDTLEERLDAVEEKITAHIQARDIDNPGQSCGCEAAAPCAEFAALSKQARELDEAL
jgi:hypothetical protein